MWCDVDDLDDDNDGWTDLMEKDCGSNHLDFMMCQEMMTRMAFVIFLIQIKKKNHSRFGLSGVFLAVGLIIMDMSVWAIFPSRWKK